jgi:hypothetical protein
MNPKRGMATGPRRAKALQSAPLALLALLAHGALVISCASGQAALPSPPPRTAGANHASLQAGTRSETAVSFARIDHAEIEFEYHLAYPVFPDYPVLNARIETLVRDCLGTFPEDAKAVWEDMRQYEGDSWAEGRAPLYLSLEWEPVTVSGDFISLLFTSYRYQGGAHGSTEQVSVNYDCRAGRFAGIEELLAPAAPDWLERLSADAQASLATQLSRGDRQADIDWIRQGAGPDRANFSCVTVSGDTLTIHFGQYQVAPYAEGILEVNLPRNGYRKAE